MAHIRPLPSQTSRTSHARPLPVTELEIVTTSNQQENFSFLHQHEARNHLHSTSDNYEVV